MSLTRLVLPAQVFLVMGALLMAVQYTHRRFLLPALAPIIYNLGIIIGGLVGAAMGEASPEAFLWGAVLGSAVGNFGLQWFGARSTGTWLTRVPAHGSSVKEYLVLALPLMLGQSVAVLDEQFVRLFGQIDSGATAALSFARQLNMVPVGVIAQAAGVAAFPFLARLAAGGDFEGLSRTTGRAARNTVFVAAAAMAALVVVARPLVSLLYSMANSPPATAPSSPASSSSTPSPSPPGASADPLPPLLCQTDDVAGGADRHCGHSHRHPGVARPLLGDGCRGVRLGLHPGHDCLRPGIARRLGSRLGVVAGARHRSVDSPEAWSPPGWRRRWPAILSIGFGTDYVDLWEAVAAAAIGGLTTIAVFLEVSYLLRAPEAP